MAANPRPACRVGRGCGFVGVQGQLDLLHGTLLCTVKFTMGLSHVVASSSADLTVIDKSQEPFLESGIFVSIRTSFELRATSYRSGLTSRVASGWLNADGARRPLLATGSVGIV